VLQPPGYLDESDQRKREKGRENESIGGQRGNHRQVSEALNLGQSTARGLGSPLSPMPERTRVFGQFTTNNREYRNI